MKLEELMSIISRKTGSYINQSMLAEILGITRQTVSNRIKNNSQVTVSELAKVEQAYNVSLLNEGFDNSEIVEIDYYQDVFASCGDGNIVFSGDKIKIPVPIILIKDFSHSKIYSIINASGNSMSPTIENHDKLIVEHWNGEQIQDNKIYVFCYNNEFFVKRLSKNIDEIIVKSDNKEYNIRSISSENAGNLKVVGKIVGLVRILLD